MSVKDGENGKRNPNSSLAFPEKALKSLRKHLHYNFEFYCWRKQIRLDSFPLPSLDINSITDDEHELEIVEL
jgi:hypothetical protein